MPDLLLTAQDTSGHVHLIVGSNSLASARCVKSLEVGARPKIVAPPEAEIHYALQKRIEEGTVEWIKKEFEEENLKTLGRKEVDNVVDAVFVTIGGENVLSILISNLCKRFRIPVNVTDAPTLCTFTLLSTHSDGPLQIGITTSGNGCKLASRIRREIASSLPPHFGSAVERLGTVRRRLWEENSRFEDSNAENEDDDCIAQRSTFNRLISESDHNAAKTRRMRWLSQICEYWPLRRLASITNADIDTILQSQVSNNPSPALLDTTVLDNRNNLEPEIILAGSGPGSPSLLTIATHRAIQTASVILADKLVPSAVLDLIPRRTPVHIARKFPGNADAAQAELLSLGLEALKRGLTVLRLKQGDPYIYGRGGEEYIFFKERGFTPIILPGITSALSAPLFAAIPPTHRNVADQVLICTGTGRRGAAPTPPPYVITQTVVFLMALHRLSSLVESLIGTPSVSRTSKTPLMPENPAKNNSPTSHSLWPPSIPCAVLERASCPDQRVIRSTLEHVCAAVEEEGSRPPGLLVVGWSCEVLIKAESQEARWVVEEGFAGLGSLDEEVAAADERVVELNWVGEVRGGMEGD
ncbi:hypothetical protein MMC07_006529 [Pseudocyphellaria aurata]|nr:hypothetical protein [Pseudocyphellaria aurata]